MESNKVDMDIAGIVIEYLTEKLSSETEAKRLAGYFISRIKDYCINYTTLSFCKNGYVERPSVVLPMAISAIYQEIIDEGNSNLAELFNGCDFKTVLKSAEGVLNSKFVMLEKAAIIESIQDVGGLLEIKYKMINGSEDITIYTSTEEFLEKVTGALMGSLKNE